MMRTAIRRSALLALIAATGLSIGCQTIKVEDGQKMAGGKNTFMGKIDVGNDASVGGALSTNNGSVRVGNNSKVKALSTKRGNVGIGAGSHVEGSISAGLGDVVLGENVEMTGGVACENGAITVNDGCKIGGSLRATSHIVVTKSHIVGNIYTSQGNIDLTGTHVEGGVNLERSANVIADGGQTVTLGPGTVVDGPIKVSVNARVKIHKDAKAKGGVEGVDPEPYGE